MTLTQVQQNLGRQLSTVAPPMVLMPIGCVIVLGLYQGDARGLTLAIIVGFEIAALFRPIWAVGALLFLEFTTANSLLDVSQSGISARPPR